MQLLFLSPFASICSRTSHVAAHVDRCNDEGGQTSWIFVRSSYSASSLVLLSDLHRIFDEEKEESVRATVIRCNFPLFEFQQASIQFFARSREHASWTTRRCTCSQYSAKYKIVKRGISITRTGRVKVTKAARRSTWHDCSRETRSETMFTRREIGRAHV